MGELVDPATDDQRQSRIQEEIDNFLLTDDTTLGNVYRWDLEGLTPQEMAGQAGTATWGFVNNYRQNLSALRQGLIPTSPTIAGQTASRVRSWLKRENWSPETREYLDSLHDSLQSAATDSTRVEREERHAIAVTQEVEKQGVPGIYVYALPHYLKHPYDEATGHTLLKVGHSSVDVFGRVGGQGRTTALPEDPVLLRVYPTKDAVSAEEERAFHGWLEAADHERNRASRAGREWFLTSLKFLDRIARERGLSVQVINDFEVGDI